MIVTIITVYFIFVLLIALFLFRKKIINKIKVKISINKKKRSKPIELFKSIDFNLLKQLGFIMISLGVGLMVFGSLKDVIQQESIDKITGAPIDEYQNIVNIVNITQTLAHVVIFGIVCFVAFYIIMHFKNSGGDYY